MTVQDLMDLLSEQDPDAEVRLMTQPSWPFEHALHDRLWTPATGSTGCDACGYPVERDASAGGVWKHEDPRHDDHDPEPESSFTPDGAPESGVVYLIEGTQLGYGSSDAWQ